MSLSQGGSVSLFIVFNVKNAFVLFLAKAKNADPNLNDDYGYDCDADCRGHQRQRYVRQHKVRRYRACARVIVLLRVRPRQEEGKVGKVIRFPAQLAILGGQARVLALPLVFVVQESQTSPLPKCPRQSQPFQQTVKLTEVLLVLLLLKQISTSPFNGTSVPLTSERITDKMGELTAGDAGRSPDSLKSEMGSLWRPNQLTWRDSGDLDAGSWRKPLPGVFGHSD